MARLQNTYIGITSKAYQIGQAFSNILHLSSTLLTPTAYSTPSNAATIIVRSLRRYTSRCCNHRTKASDRLFIKACVKSADADALADALISSIFLIPPNIPIRLLLPLQRHVSTLAEEVVIIAIIHTVQRLLILSIQYFLDFAVIGCPASK